MQRSADPDYVWAYPYPDSRTCGDADVYPFASRDVDSHSNAFGHADQGRGNAYSNSDFDRHSDRVTDGDADAVTDADAKSHGHGVANRDSYPDANIHRDASANSDGDADTLTAKSQACL